MRILATRRIHALMFAFVIGAGAARALAPQPAFAASSGSVTGIVTTIDGRPIAAALVTLNGNGADRTGRTDDRGRFTLAAVPGGTYGVRIVARGYDPLAGETIDVRAADTTHLALEMVVSSTSLVTIGRVGTSAGPAISTASVPTAELNAQTASARGVASVADMLAQGAISATVIHPSGGSPALPVVVALRGPDPTETLVDIDGHSINSGGTGAFDLSLLDPADLASVQLVYGISPSSLVGPNTIDGAINVRTLEPTAQSHGLLRLSGGSYGSFAETLSATGTQDRLGYAFSLHRTTTQGEVDGQEIAASDGSIQRVGSAIDGNTALGKVRYSFGSGDGFVALTFRDQSQIRDISAGLSSIVGIPDGAAPPPVSGDQGHARQTLDVNPTATPTVFNSFAGSSLLAHNAGYGLDLQLPVGEPAADGFARTTLLFRHLTSLADQSVSGPAAGSSLYLYNDRDRLGDDSLQIDHVMPKSVLSLKLATRSEQLDTQQVIGGQATTDQAELRRPLDDDPAAPAILTGLQPLSALGQTQRSAVVRYAFDPTAKLHYTLAGYYSDFTSFGTSLDPRAGFVWTPSAGSAVRFSAGTSFQSPQLPELYVPATLPPPDANGYIDIGNANLKADHASEYDLGYEHVFAGPAPTRVSVDLYRTNLRTPAQRYIPPATCTAASAVSAPVTCESFPINVGGAVYTGAEFRLERNLGRAAIVRAAYSINSSYPTSISPLFQNGTIVVGEQFAGSPLHRGTLAFENTPKSGLGYNAALVYEDGYNGLNRPAYATLDAGLTWHAAAGFDVGLYGTNLTDVYDDRFTVAGAGVTYGGINGPIASDAYALQGRKLTFTLTRRY